MLLLIDNSFAHYYFDDSSENSISIMRKPQKDIHFNVNKGRNEINYEIQFIECHLF